jgi:hypothetical protein
LPDYTASLIYELGAGMVWQGHGLADQNRSFWPPRGSFLPLVEFFFARGRRVRFQRDLSIDRTAAAE